MSKFEPTHPPFDVEEGRRLRREGHSTAEVATRFGVSRSCVYERLGRMKVEDPGPPAPTDRFQVRELWGYAIRQDTGRMAGGRAPAVTAHVVDTGSVMGPVIAMFDAADHGGSRQALLSARCRARALNEKYRPLDAAIGIVW